jgi:hypothetical protein
MYAYDVGALCEGMAIQRRSDWCAGLSCLSRSSNHRHETDRKNQMNQTPTLPRAAISHMLETVASSRDMLSRVGRWLLMA